MSPRLLPVAVVALSMLCAGAAFASGGDELQLDDPAADIPDMDEAAGDAGGDLQVAGGSRDHHSPLGAGAQAEAAAEAQSPTACADLQRSLAAGSTTDGFAGASLGGIAIPTAVLERFSIRTWHCLASAEGSPVVDVVNGAFVELAGSDRSSVGAWIMPTSELSQRSTWASYFDSFYESAPLTVGRYGTGLLVTRKRYRGRRRDRARDARRFDDERVGGRAGRPGGWMTVTTAAVPSRRSISVGAGGAVPVVLGAVVAVSAWWAFDELTARIATRAQLGLDAGPQAVLTAVVGCSATLAVLLLPRAGAVAAAGLLAAAIAWGLLGSGGEPLPVPGGELGVRLVRVAGSGGLAALAGAWVAIAGWRFLPSRHVNR